MSLPDDQQTQLIIRAQQGDREAFDRLYEVYEKRIYGCIRARANNDADAKMIAQQTCLQLWQKMSIFDHSRKGFEAFAKYWAGIMKLRYYDAVGDLRQVEMHFSELLAPFPDLEQEQEISDVLARLASYQEQSTERTLIVDEEERMRVEVYQELLRMTFGGSSPPHQLIAFGFTKLLGWKPREVVAKLSDIPLKSLGHSSKKHTWRSPNSQTIRGDPTLRSFISTWITHST